MRRAGLGRIIELHRRRWCSRWAGNRAKYFGELVEGSELGVAKVGKW
jgi:hypothetical protein